MGTADGLGGTNYYGRRTDTCGVRATYIILVGELLKSLLHTRGGSEAALRDEQEFLS